METITDLRSISVLIPDGENWDAVKVLRCLGQTPAIKTHILSNSRRPLARFSRYCAHCHSHKSANDEDWIDVIRRLVQRWKIDVVLPVTLRGVVLISQNRAAICEVAAIPPLAEFDLIRTTQNKWLLYYFAKQRELPVAPSVFVGKAGEAIRESADLDTIEYPALLKPTSLDGGCSIVKINTPRDLYRVWEGKGTIKAGEQYILQSYIPGVVVSLGAFCQRGEIIVYTLWRALLPSKNPFISARAMEYVLDERVMCPARRLISALGWEGIANIDFIVDERDQTAKILEFNPRFWQSLLGSLVAGVNFPVIACLSAMGLGYSNMHQDSSVKYVHPVASGKMRICRLIGRRPPVSFRWRESGLRFTVQDPLPEVVDALRRTLRRLTGHLAGNRWLSNQRNEPPVGESK